MPDEYADLFSVRKIFDTYRPTVMVRDLLNKSQSVSSFASFAHSNVADYGTLNVVDFVVETASLDCIMARMSDCRPGEEAKFDIAADDAIAFRPVVIVAARF